MLSIHPTNPQKRIPNLLPARINHSGPINTTPQHWAPSTDAQGTQHVHFRGRHLHGTPLPLPASHTGAILVVTDKLAPQAVPQPRELEDDEVNADDADEQVEVRVAEQVGSFDSVVVWGHGGVVEEGDLFVRGVKEWVGFAGVVHCDDEGEGEVGKEGGEESAKRT